MLLDSAALPPRPYLGGGSALRVLVVAPAQKPGLDSPMVVRPGAYPLSKAHQRLFWRKAFARRVPLNLRDALKREQDHRYHENASCQHQTLRQVGVTQKLSHDGYPQ